MNAIPCCFCFKLPSRNCVAAAADLIAGAADCNPGLTDGLAGSIAFFASSAPKVAPKSGGLAALAGPDAVGNLGSACLGGTEGRRVMAAAAAASCLCFRAREYFDGLGGSGGRGPNDFGGERRREDVLVGFAKEGPEHNGCARLKSVMLLLFLTAIGCPVVSESCISGSLEGNQ